MGTSEVVLSSYDRSICHPTPRVGVHQQWAHKVLHFKMLLVWLHFRACDYRETLFIFYNLKKIILYFWNFNRGDFLALTNGSFCQDVSS